MNVLIVYATQSELAQLDLEKISATVLITGVGMVATTFHLTEHLSKNKYDLILNVGIAGSFSNEIQIGETVNIVQDCFGDFGAEDDENFIDVFEIGLEEKNESLFENGVITFVDSAKFKCIDALRKVKGITVNKVHGNEKSIARIKSKYNPDIETMEGAAVFYVCKLKNIPCIQIRSISNFIEKRNRANWDIKGAVKNLNSFIQAFIDELSASKK